MNARRSNTMMSALLMATVLVHGASALLSLALPPQCYVSCLSQALAKVGCAFDDLSCWCGISNSVFTGPLVGCVNINCDSSDASAGQSFVESVCAVLAGGQSTLPASLATIIPSAAAAKTNTSSVPTTSAIPSTTLMTVTTTNSAGAVVQTSVPAAGDASVIPVHTDGTGASTGALIGGIVGGIIGFLILALIIISVVLYLLVRRSVEKRAKEREYLREHKFDGDGSRSSVAASASDTPEDDLRDMEPSFWGVVTRPKQALRVVNG